MIGPGLSGPNLDGADWAVSVVTPARSHRVRVGSVRSGGSTVVCRPRKIKRSISACRHVLSSSFLVLAALGEHAAAVLVAVLKGRWVFDAFTNGF